MIGAPRGGPSNAVALERIDFITLPHAGAWASSGDERARYRYRPRDALPAVSPVIEAFEQLHVPYHIGGSFAVSSFGVPRASTDIEVIAELVTERPAG